jgi:uncharacterized protein YabE (DUF348 family)
LLVSGAVADHRITPRAPDHAQTEEETMRRGVIALTAQAAILGVAVAGAAIFVSTQRTVVLSVDGEQRTVQTYARTVGDLLDKQDLVVGPQDSITPAAGATLADGDQVSLRRGRQLVLSVDGATRSVWTTAQSVDEALGALGLRDSAAYVSVSRSGRIPLEGVDVTVRTPRTVTVLVDGRRATLTSTAATVGELLAEGGVTLGERDVVTPAAVAYPLNGDTVTVSRVEGRRLVKQVPVKFRTVRKADDTMYKGDTVVRREGKPGLIVRTFDVTYVDGRPTTRALVDERRRAKPVTKVVAFGTREIPAGRVRIPSTDGLNWNALAQCESGGRPDAVGGGGLYFGLYQFDLQTWRGQGGTGNPADASPEEQTRRAKSLFADRGRQPWPYCGRLL